MRIESRRSRHVVVLAGVLWIAVGASPGLAQQNAGVAAGAERAVPVGEAPESLPHHPAETLPVAFSPPRVAPALEGAVMRAWHAPADTFEGWIDQTRRAALLVGAWNLDPGARALIHRGSEGTPLERAQGAVRLAPDLPAAHLALARVLWLQEGSPMAAIRSVVAGLLAARYHTEASLWFGGSALYILATALVATGLLVVLLAGIPSLLHAAHDLGHLVRVPVPLFAGFAGLGALLMVPLLLGEGLLGLALGLLCVGMLYGSNARRLALTLAAVALFCGLHPVPQLASVALSAFPKDPVARAAYTTASGLASPVDLARLERAAETDPLALRGLAIHARQMGNLGTADALYQRLLEEDPTNVALINNAANVRLDLGHVHSALELYDRADALTDSAVVLFNLSQAYGRAFQVDELNRVLAEAQQVDSDLLVQFTRLQRARNENFLVDLPLSTRMMWRRAADAAGDDALTAEFRAGLAPGWLGASADHAAGLLAVLVGALWLLSLRFQPSSGCPRCGTRKCGRCGHPGSSDGLCDSCTRLFYQPEKTDRALRTERVEALRERARRMRRLATLGSVMIPGAAGFLAQRPLRGLLGAFCFTLAAAALVWRGGVVPDPLVAGAAAPIAFMGVASIAGLVYLAVVAVCLASHGED